MEKIKFLPLLPLCMKHLRVPYVAGKVHEYVCCVSCDFPLIMDDDVMKCRECGEEYGEPNNESRVIMNHLFIISR